MTANRDRQLALLSLVAIVAIVIVQFLFWRGVWFGRPLDSQELAQYLEGENPRKIQHALEQLVGRLERGDPTVQQWYPTVSQLADNPHHEVRAAAAWMMGHDPRSSLFHKTLLRLLEDPELNVRRNAALALVRFQDPGGIVEIREMLRPYKVTAPVTGRVSYQVTAGQEVEIGTPLLFVKNDVATQVAYAGVSGRAQGLLAEGSSVAAGDLVLDIQPETTQVWESLRALYFVGDQEDLELVESILQDGRYAEDVRRQAASTYHAIHKRAASNGKRVSK